MSLALFYEAPTGTIETIFDVHENPCFKWAHVDNLDKCNILTK